MSNPYLEKAKEIVLARIPREDYSVFLFGSRAEGQERETSDLDIGFLGIKPVPEKLIREIREALDESVIPYRVDLVDFHKVDPAFKVIALKKVIVWNQAKN